MLRTAVVCILGLGIVPVSPAVAATDSAGFAARIESLPIPRVGEDAQGVDAAYLAVLTELREALPNAERAELLEKLRERGFLALARTDPVLGRIAAAAVVGRFPSRFERPEEYVIGLLRVGYLHHCRSDLDLAERTYRKAIDFAERELGPTSEMLAQAHESLSWVLSDRQDYRAALDRVASALEIRRRQKPVQAERIISTLNAKAAVYYFADDKERAAATWEEALALVGQLPNGPEGFDWIARIRNNLGETYLKLGRLRAAREHLEEARHYYGIAGPDGTPARQLASTLLNLADLYYARGDYSESIEAYEQALAGHAVWVGDDAIRRADNLSNFALVLEEAGRPEEARARLLEALELRRRSSRETRGAAVRDEASERLRRTYIARDLTRLGSLQQRMGEAAGRDLLLRALILQEESAVLVADDGADPFLLDRAVTLLALARLELESGDPEIASSYLLRAIEMLEARAPRHYLAVEAYRLAGLLALEGRGSLEWIDRGVALAREIYGPESVRTAELIFAKARVLAAQGRRDLAVEETVRGYLLSLEHLVRVIQAFPEDQAAAFAAVRRGRLDLALTLVARQGGKLEPGALIGAWESVASGRAVVFDTQLSRRRLALASEDERIRSLVEDLTAARARLARLLVQALRDPGFQRREVKAAEAEVAAAETALARASSRLAGEPAPVRVDLAELTRSLPSDSTLVSYVYYRDSEDGELRVLAWVLRSRSELPVAVPLGLAERVEKAVADWRATLLAQPVDARWRSAEGAATAFGERLRRLIWDPVAPHAGRPDLVLVVPAGALHLVNFAALQTAGGRFLIEEGWTFHNLSSERSLVDPPSGPTGDRGLLLVGGVDYSGALADESAPVARLTRGREAAADGHGCLPLLPYFHHLPATLEEVAWISDLWRRLPETSIEASTVLRGRRATEARLADEVSGRRVVHLATHGFVAGDGCAVPGGSASRSAIEAAAVGSSQEALLLSGLAMAGANQRPVQAGGGDDGFLLTEEVASLDLDGVEWVVLSACDTGAGVRGDGEGIGGLSRAFQLSGARTVIRSQWQVEDRAARAWMERLYESRFVRGLDTAHAVREASLAVLGERRSQGLDTSPVSWAAFVAEGDWR